MLALVGRPHEVERGVVQPPGGEGSPVGRGVHPEPTLQPELSTNLSEVSVSGEEKAPSRSLPMGCGLVSRSAGLMFLWTSVPSSCLFAVLTAVRRP